MNQPCLPWHRIFRLGWGTRSLVSSIGPSWFREDPYCWLHAIDLKLPIESLAHNNAFLLSLLIPHTEMVILPLGMEFCSNVQIATLVAQEKISFGISVMSSSYTMIKDIKDSYNEVDSRLIAKEVRRRLCCFMEQL